MAPGKTILLVDDNADIVRAVGGLLESEGYNVVSANTAEEGLEELTRTTPDLILLDVNMPGMGGVGFISNISAAGGKLKHPVLVLTTRANMEEFFTDIDVDGFISKSCDPDDLLEEIRRIILLRGGTDDGPRTTKVFLGEDDATINENIVHVLAGEGYDVSSFRSGSELLQQAIVEKPDLIVIKLILANMNGDAVAKMLKDMPDTKDIPIVLYDDGNTEMFSSRYTGSDTGIKKFVRSNDPPSLLFAVKSVLA